MFGLTVDNRLFANDFFDRRNHFGKRDGLVVAEVDDFVGCLIVVQGTEDPFYDIVDIGVVAAGGAITEDWDRRAGFN